MGPLSAIAAAFFLVLLGLVWIGTITASLNFLGWVAIVAAIVIILDTFWVGSASRWTAWRNRG